jgi:ABC-2 type transport system permease protein
MNTTTNQRMLTISASAASDQSAAAPVSGFVVAPTALPTVLTTALTYAARSVRRFIRSPQLLVVEALTSVMFLLIFRYVFGGAIQTGGVEYVNFLIPALAAVSGLFGSGIVGVAEDAESGMFDRLRSLPVPRPALLIGRSLADTALNMWGMFVTIVVGFAVGFRVNGGPLRALAAVGLCLVFAAALSWLAIFLGLIAGSAQAAQGLSFAVFPLIFVSSAYVPVESMPTWMQPVAENQPITAMVGAVRSLVIGGDSTALLGHSTTWFVTRSLIWSAVLMVVFGTLAARRFSKL